jgi:hypothetical protein
MSIVLQSTGGGSVTIAEPTTASNFTQTLPAANGTIVTTESPQSGSVLQVVNATYATSTTRSSSTFADTGLTASITPKFSTSKILVFVNMCGCGKRTNDTSLQLKLLRNSTDILKIDENAGYTGSTLRTEIGSVSTSFLDSPATTSSTTYKVQFASSANNASVQINDYYNSDGNTTSTITLMEVSA